MSKRSRSLPFETRMVFDGDRKGWVLTVGLAAFGLPELEVRHVHPLWLMPDAASLLNRIGEYMLTDGQTIFDLHPELRGVVEEENTEIDDKGRQFYKGMPLFVPDDAHVVKDGQTFGTVERPVRLKKLPPLPEQDQFYKADRLCVIDVEELLVCACCKGTDA